MEQIFKYPRTQHIEGSRLQPGDEDLESVAFEQIAGRHIVVEEKVDGANCAISFSPSGQLLLQSRGHYLTGGAREKHFNLFKQWAAVLTAPLFERLGTRHILYGEWLYAKHTVFYDTLPHYLMEFDVLDVEERVFLDTPRRLELLDGLPVPHVRVLFDGVMQNLEQLKSLLGPSHFIRPGHLDRLTQQCRKLGLDPGRALKETDPSGFMEGLYIKVEEEGTVTERYRFIRVEFLTAVLNSEDHWLNRPIIPNLLAEGVDIFEGPPS